MTASGEASRPFHPVAWVILTVVATAGIAARLWGLGDWPLAVDEYHVVRSVENILREGLPEFPAGGFYMRGILHQYLTAPLMVLTSNPEWSVRVIAVVANLAAVPAVYLIARRLGGVPAAIGATLLFMLSMWEVEFARFGRMYVLLQTFFIWQVYLLLRATENRSQLALDGMIVLSMVGVTVHEGTIFLWLLVLIPFLSNRFPLDLRNGTKLAASFAAISVWQMAEFRTTSLPSALSEQIAQPQTGWVAGLLSLPDVNIDALLAAPVGTGAWVVLSVFIVFVLVRMARADVGIRSWLLWSVLLCLCLSHLYGVAIMLAATVWLCAPTHLEGPLRSPWFRNSVVAASTAGLILWGAAFVSAGMTPYGAIKTLINYPPVIPRLVDQWRGPMPWITGILIAVVLARGIYEVARSRREEVDVSQGWRVTAAAFILPAGAMAVIDTSLLTSRYSFFLYGLALILLSEGVVRLVRLLPVSPPKPSYVVGVVFVAIFWISEDHSLNYLSNVNQPEVRHRTNFSWEVEEHLFRRPDLRSPAKFVNARVEPDEVVVSGVAAADFYLERVHYRYIPFWGANFSEVSALGGSRELWSNCPLLWRPGAVEELVRAGNSVWLLLSGDPYGIRAEREQAWRERLSRWLVYSTEKGWVQVYHIPSGAIEADATQIEREGTGLRTLIGNQRGGGEPYCTKSPR